MNNNLNTSTQPSHQVPVGHFIAVEDCLESPFYIIILASDQTHVAHAEIVRDVLSNDQDVHAWTIDMEDEDRVIRIVSQQNISIAVATRLLTRGINSSIMGVFIKEPR